MREIAHNSGFAATTSTASSPALPALNVTTAARSVSQVRAVGWRGALAREPVFWAAGALLFIASSVGTVYWCGSMAGGMPMPGGWTMSMAWMRMADQTWPGAAAMFLGMWLLMMVAMMLPSLVPALADYRHSLPEPGGNVSAWLAALAGAGYFFVWTIFGAIAYPLGLAVALAEMHWRELARAAPLVAGVLVLAAGAAQFTSWKALHLAHCRDATACSHHEGSGLRVAWRHGLRMGWHCCVCCFGLILILLVTGVMSLAGMAVIAAAINIERLAPQSIRVARAIGALAIASGAVLLAHALLGI